MTITIKPYRKSDKKAVLELSMQAWSPVFPKMEKGVPKFVYDNFYPQGWETRQINDLTAVLDEEGQFAWLAFLEEELVGWIHIRLHPEDKMGEIYILAVSPSYQRQGVGKALMTYACNQIKQKGMEMVMVETGGDPGHAPARKTYENFGFEQWPVARYFKKL